MSVEYTKVRDPVCDMMVDPRELSIDYLGMHFSFCSEQCKQRFLDNPNLYIGTAGHKSPRQEGRVVLKRRRLKLSEPLSAEAREGLIKQLQSMMGIKRVDVEGDIVDITYDLLEATEAQIEETIAQSGAVLGQSLARRLSRGFVKYLEETEIENLEVKPQPHHHGH
ncbi:YHS domain-containing protein [Thiogranum longum]|uniref:YHS domain-containing protein n=1 Tax=Thiogranum longum TaxID=1537524 RepID=A0A4R1HCS8_9GAMM|nr:YHS domain-containing protein [Thiogranum longum]TCK18020.1 YHS domain-containing protein [Thiogranum longum]